MFFIRDLSNGVFVGGPFPYHDEAEDFIRKNNYPYNWAVTGAIGTSYSYSSSLLKEKDKNWEKKQEQEKQDFENRWRKAAEDSQRGVIMWTR